MRRRKFLSLLGSVVAAKPLLSSAQRTERLPRVGVIQAAYPSTDPEAQARIGAFLSTLQELGWDSGRNLRVEIRWPGDDFAQAKLDVAELVASAPDVIVAATNPVLSELQRSTTTIPIVFTQVSDPVATGFVSAMVRPGGNITGFQNFGPEIGGKWLGLLKEAAPEMRRVAVLHNPFSAANLAFLRGTEAVAQSVGVQVIAAPLRDSNDIEATLATFAREARGGLVVVPHNITTANRRHIIELAARHSLPAIYPFRFFAIDGGLMSYGVDQNEQWRGAARYVDRILRGEKAGELPVQAATKYELVINLRTAKALGLQMPAALPLRADEIIE
jgi:putative ABC transport system substrate-binding protein